MPTMERERGQPGVLRAGHTAFSSPGAEAFVTSHPLTRSRAPFVEDTGEPEGQLVTQGKTHHHTHDVGNLFPLIHLWASQKPTEIQL